MRKYLSLAWLSCLLLFAVASASEKPPVSDPFDPASCPGEHLTIGQYAIKYAGSKNFEAIGRFKVYGRSRKCVGNSDCTDWKADDRAFNLGVKNHLPATEGIIEVVTDNQDGDIRSTIFFASDDYLVQRRYTDWDSYQMFVSLEDRALTDLSSWTVSSEEVLRVGKKKLDKAQQPGWITDTCLRIPTSSERKDTETGVVFQYEVVFLSYLDPR